MSSPTAAVAVVGGGLAGLVAAEAVATALGDGERTSVVVFDLGARGLGGRCGHREDVTRELRRFDHGAQFLSCGARDDVRWSKLVASWNREGFLERWNPRIVEISAAGKPSELDRSAPSFFDVASADELYVSPGGMRNLSEGLARRGHFQVVRGCRVRRVHHEGALWTLHGNSGNEAHHEAAEKDARDAEECLLGRFRALILTDVMLSFPPWHRCALLGLDTIAPELVQVLREVRMAPLFSLMVSFPHGSTEGWPDAAVIRDETLQWACRMASKPGEALKEDCWVCVSTRDFAEACLLEVPMASEAPEGQGSEGKSYMPQQEEYLRADPADAMLAAFQRLFQAELKPISKQCQRWGAAYVERSAKPSHFTRDGPCLVDASLALGVCGDFLSPEGPRGGASSIYCSALSALAVAEAISTLVLLT